MALFPFRSIGGTFGGAPKMPQITPNPAFEDFYAQQQAAGGTFPGIMDAWQAQQQAGAGGYDGSGIIGGTSMDPRMPGYNPQLTDTTTGQPFTPGSPEAQAMDALRQMGQSAQQEPAPDPAAVEQLRQMGQQAQTPLDPATIADLQRLTGQLQQPPDPNVMALQQTVQRLQQPMMAPGRYTWQGQPPATLFQNLGIPPPRPGQTIWGSYGGFGSMPQTPSHAPWTPWWGGAQMGQPQQMRGPWIGPQLPMLLSRFAQGGWPGMGGGPLRPLQQGPLQPWDPGPYAGLAPDVLRRLGLPQPGQMVPGPWKADPNAAPGSYFSNVPVNDQGMTQDTYGRWHVADTKAYT